MSEWRDIETAPKDGTPVLVGRAGVTGVMIAAYAQHRTVKGYSKWREQHSLGRTVWHEPTHWMPLPEPPLTTGRG